MANPFVFLRRPSLEESWLFVPEELVRLLDEGGGVSVINEVDEDIHLESQADLSEVVGIANFSQRLERDEIDAAPKLKIIGGIFDNAGTGSELSIKELEERGIAVVDATRAWAQSVAECAFGLALCALRSIPQWHCRIAAGEQLWVYQANQFCDNPNFVNGDLGEKKVGVMGLGQIGSRIAKWCIALGAEVCGFDPYLPDSAFEEWGVEKVDLDALVDRVDIVFVAIPPTPSARGILNRERIQRLQQGALVNIITRVHSVDMEALRERILADELFGAFDVYDIEPLPIDDPLRNRENVVHTPHIAGRTKDTNLRVARLIAGEFLRAARGEELQERLTSRDVEVRTTESPTKAG